MDTNIGLIQRMEGRNIERTEHIEKREKEKKLTFKNEG